MIYKSGYKHMIVRKSGSPKKTTTSEVIEESSFSDPIIILFNKEEDLVYRINAHEHDSIKRYLPNYIYKEESYLPIHTTDDKLCLQFDKEVEVTEEDNSYQISKYYMDSYNYFLTFFNKSRQRYEYGNKNSKWYSHNDIVALMTKSKINMIQTYLQMIYVTVYNSVDHRDIGLKIKALMDITENILLYTQYLHTDDTDYKLLLKTTLKKSHDYTGDRDFLANFISFSKHSTIVLGLANDGAIINTEDFYATVLGFVFRMGDKIGRIITFHNQNKLDLKDESVYDSILDLINYCIILRSYLMRIKPIQ